MQWTDLINIKYQKLLTNLTIFSQHLKKH